jgi:hypothetical protein
MRCEYDRFNKTFHSRLIAIGLDGRGIYGAHESNGTLPILDACGGHTGPTPESTIKQTDGTTVTFGGGANVYHYHMVDDKPISTINCFGPVADVATAKALYSQCNSGFVTVCTSLGLITYDTDCPIFNQQGVGPTYNMNFTETPTCKACGESCQLGSDSIPSGGVNALTSTAVGVGRGINGLMLMGIVVVVSV